MQVLILAGGKGTRLASAVGDLPKPLALVDGRPFVEYLMDFWTGEGVTEFLLSTGYRAGFFERHFGQVYKGVPVRYATEAEPLGTGGGLTFAVRALKLKKPFWICNGDTLLHFSAPQMREFHFSRGADFTVAAVPPPGEERYGALEFDSDGRLKDQGGNEAVNGGVYLADPSIFLNETVRPASLEKDFFPRWTLEGKKIYGYRTPGPFLDIGVPESYASASLFIQLLKKKG